MVIVAAVSVLLSAASGRSALPLNVPKKIAVLIGVQYVNPVFRLHTKPDVDAMAAVLKGDKFKFDSIHVLDTQESTKCKAIRDEFVSLSKEVLEGDTVVVFYSGHGSQVPDDNGDESDGYDETIIPADGEINGTNQIRDDELGKFLDAIWAKKPANVVTIFDCCHSGTGTRDVGAPRVFPRAPGMSVVPTQEKVKDELQELSSHHPTVSLAACQPNELAHETLTGQAMGAFTWALVRTLNDPETNRDTTISALMERTSAYLHDQNRSQTPVFEGNPGTVFMTGAIRESRPYFSLDGLLLQAGRLVGVTRGSRYGIYNAGTETPSEAAKLCEAVVVGRPGPYTARLNLVDDASHKIDKSVRAQVEAGKGLRAFEISHFVDNGVRLAIDPTVIQAKALDLGVLQSQTSVLSDKPFAADLNKDRDYDLLLTWADRGTGADTSKRDALVIRRADGSRVNVSKFTVGGNPYEFPLDASSNDVLRKAIEQESLVRYLQDLDNRDQRSQIKLQFRLVSVEAEPDLDEPGKQVFKRVSSVLRAEGGNSIPAAELGETVAIQVKNVGTQDAYVNILDFDADGNVTNLWPKENNPEGGTAFTHESETTMNDPEAGWKFLTKDGLPVVFKFVEPAGIETLKLLATDQKVDLSFLTTRDIPRGDPEVPIARLLRMSVQGKRMVDNSPSTRDWWTAKLLIQLRPANRP